MIKLKWPDTSATTFICGCKIGQRSANAAMRLAQMGYTAGNLETGIDGWMREGLPVVTPPPNPPVDDLFL